MQHVRPISRDRVPATASSLLEKQAMSDLLQRNLSQIAAFLSLITGLKQQEN